MVWKRLVMAALVLGAIGVVSGAAQAENWECQKGREDPNRFESHSITFDEDSVEISRSDRVQLEQLSDASRMMNVVCVIGVISDSSDEMDHEDLMLRRAQAVAQVMIEYGAINSSIIVDSADHKFSTGRFNKYFDDDDDSKTSMVEILFMR